MHFIRKKLSIFFLCLFLLSGCSQSTGPSVPPASPEAYRDNTPVCFIPSADGTLLLQNESACVDYSNITEGYIMVKYTGSVEKVRLQITGGDQVEYTYHLKPDTFEAFPLSAGSGKYNIGIYENIIDDTYSVVLSEILTAEISNPFGPFLYSNQYVVFDSSSQTVEKAKELAENAGNDLDVVSSVYNFVVSNITYDYDKAQNVVSGYTPVADETLQSGKGICLDYASLMTSMLRSQNIPTRLEVGYAGDAYHAWISTYIKDTGWVNGIIQFDGNEWQLMDPTYASTNGEKKLKSFLKNKNNYVVKYRY